jgi:transposase
MNSLSSLQMSTQALDHHGLVMATIHKIGLIDKIDSLIPVSEAHGARVTMGERVAAMIINGLGFIDNRLYIFPEFLEGKPVERLFGEGISAQDFNDDCLGRCLDALYEYGITKAFCTLSFQIGLEQNLLKADGYTNVHLDSSTISLTGDYDGQVPVAPQKGADTSKVDLTESITGQEGSFCAQGSPDLCNRPIPWYGHSKDHRSDLKQMVINLATTGAAGFPVWMETHNGNASDKTILHDAATRMQAFTDSLAKSKSDPDPFMVIADSAIYEACVNKGSDMLWLSRVPESHKEACVWLQKSDESFAWTVLEDGYKISCFESNYKGVPQRWCLVYSKQGYEREKKTFDRLLEKQKDDLGKSLKKLIGEVFKCEKDAQKSLDDFNKSLEKKYYNLSASSIQPHSKHKKRGRPREGEIPAVVGYSIVAELNRNEEKIELKRRMKGRFIVATNQMDVTIFPDLQMLPEYKEQSKVEGKFLLLKDPSFEISSVFLKNPERISALMMVMTLCLMVYALAQYQLREALAAAQDTVPNQLKKEIKNPTLKWVFCLFQGIHVVKATINGIVHEVVTNLNETRRKIIGYFGENAMQIYGLSIQGISSG